MIYKISYWGGPKDGEKSLLNYRPKEEVFCIDAVSEIDPVEFYEKLEKNPLRTLKYHKYILQYKPSDVKNKKSEEFTYIFSGMV